MTNTKCIRVFRTDSRSPEIYLTSSYFVHRTDALTSLHDDLVSDRARHDDRIMTISCGTEDIRLFVAEMRDSLTRYSNVSHRNVTPT
jgi:hypothetical protein